MLATVLKGDIAEKQSIFIMRAFKEMRHFVRQNMQFVTKNEIKQITDSHETRFNKIVFLTNSEVKDFDRENPTLKIKNNNECHDRYIIIDYKTKDEKVYHCGASSKDAGNKVCTINEIEDINMIHPVIDKLLKNKDVVL